VLAEEITGGWPGFDLAENTDDLLVSKKLLWVDGPLCLMKTKLTQLCTNQQGAAYRNGSLLNKYAG
jgi:hypothetical protein